MTEEQARQKASEQRKLYVNVTLYGVINLVAILIWAFSGGGYFWPMWLIFIGGIILVIRSVKVGLFPTAISEYLPFLQEEWVEERAKELLKDQKKSGAKTPSEMSGKDKASEAEKPAAKPSSTKPTSAVKKTASKATSKPERKTPPQAQR